MVRILTQLAFHRVQEHPKQSSDEEVMAFRLEAMTIVSPWELVCWCTLNEFLSPNGSEFGLTYLMEQCSPISLVYLSI